MIEAERIVDAADRVLARPGYRELPVTGLEELVERIRGRIAEFLFELFLSDATAQLGTVIAIVVVTLVVALALVTLLRLRRSGTVEETVVEDAGGASVEELLRRADEAVAAGDLDAAVRARYGAIVLLLVEAEVLPGRPGTTVGEVDTAVAARVPEVAGTVAASGRVLADAVYGHRPPTPADASALADAVDDVRRAARPAEVLA